MAQTPLTLEEAIAIALDDNHTVGAADHNIAAAEAQRRAAIGLRMPQISAMGAYAYLGKDIGLDMNGLKPSVEGFAANLASSGFIPVEQIPTLQGLLSPILAADWSVTLQQRSVGSAGGVVTLPLWMGGRINAANRAARLNSEAARVERDRTADGVVTELVARYFGVALAREVVGVRREVVEGVKHHLRDAEALERNGMIARSERLYVEVKLSEAERELVAAELMLQTAAAALQTTLGGSLDRHPVTAMFIVDTLAPLGVFVDMARERNPQLRQLDIKRQLAHESLRVERAGFLPEVVAMGGGSFYNYQVSGLVPRWAVGVGVKIKLFDGLRRENLYKAARRTEQRVAELQMEAEAEVSLLVQKLYNALRECHARTVSIESSLAFAEEYLRTREIAFREGAGSATEMIDARIALAAARVERLQAACNFDIALAQLLEAVGESSSFTDYMHNNSARTVTR